MTDGRGDPEFSASGSGSMNINIDGSDNPTTSGNVYDGIDTGEPLVATVTLRQPSIPRSLGLEHTQEEDLPENLYHILENAISELEDTSLNIMAGTGGANNSSPGAGTSATMTPAAAKMSFTQEQQRRKEIAENMWDTIRRWLWDHEDLEFRAAAIRTLGQDDMTPFHLMCRLLNPPVDILADFVQVEPDVVKRQDSHGWLPIHIAAANGVSTDVFQLLVSTYPESILTQDKQNRTPLHFYVSRKFESAMAMAVNTELLASTGAAKMKERSGLLPMHYACVYGTHPVVLQKLADAYPEGCVAKDSKGRTPMHLAMVNAHRNANPGVIEVLLNGPGKQTINDRDEEGKTPLHSLSIGLRSSGGSRSGTGMSLSMIKQSAAAAAAAGGTDHNHPMAFMSESDQMAQVAECLALYLAAEPTPTQDFLTSIQQLPEELQDVAVVSPHVRAILNQKIVQRFPTSIWMLDGYWLLIIIICFEITTTDEIDRRFNNPSSAGDNGSFFEGGGDRTGALVFLFLGAFYFLAREVIQIVSLWSLGSLNSWFFDATNWLDMAVIVMVSYYSVLMAGVFDEFDADKFRSGAAFTKLVLWMAVISFLKSTLVDFAVFVGGVFYVVRRLVAFLLAVAVILLAFAQMFFFIYSQRDVCLQNPIDDAEFEAEFGFEPCNFPHCTFEDSLLKVYTMMMGEIGTESRYDDVLVAQILYFFYAFLVVILLSNVLIAIVTDSYEIIQNDRAAIVFWSNRLDFVAEMDAISSVINDRFCSRRKELPAPTQEEPYNRNNASRPGAAPTREYIDGGSPDGLGGGSGQKDYFRAAWKQIMDLFESNFYDDVGLGPNSIEFWCYLCYQGFAILVLIPGWLMAGIVTAGWLWPPQVREYLFVQKETVVSRAELDRQKLDQLREIQSDINQLKSDIRREMAADRDEMVRMKSEVEAVQSEVLADLQQIKELMGTLLGGVDQQR